ncbi:protocadherin Fat 4 isoform X2 [Microcaecilia unicolor]|uniref:Protocadherin Fat 4-like isoform X2 n=1 Tax=Microcaecilia unicolor TaxID=1415580 RepID=A0A6P7XHV8_9AMPH|nr:protocadherin Fat 4-like isoform X2 [Microcaecilia unicolor]
MLTHLLTARFSLSILELECLSLINEVDRENISLLTVKIKAFQLDKYYKTADAVVVVTIEDENDNAPEFEQSVYSISIPENSPNGTTVHIVTAFDKDEGGFNGNFAIIPENSPFQISDKGAITVWNSSELDRETMKETIFQVWAVDAEMEGLNSSALLNITLLDINDNNPEFEMEPFIFTILEGDYRSGLPVKVGSVSARDLDEGANGQITFHVSSEDGKDEFTIQQNGILTTQGLLDREFKDKYELLLHASDNGIPQRQNFTHITVCVLDVNDNSPCFTETEYSATIRVANIKKGDVVLIISAVDKDLGHNSLISYSFESPSNNFFINESTGEIIVLNLARVTTDTVTVLSVIATDHGVPALTAKATVLLCLLVNDTDFGLVFESYNYKFIILEEGAVGTRVGSVKAVTGSLAITVAYSVKTSPDKFSITNDGNIVTRTSLNREERDLYNIVIEAVDSRTPPKTAVTVVAIAVNDINDNPPLFSTLIQTRLTALEGQDSIDFGTFQATDKDIGNNSIISYFLKNCFNGLFHINSSTGSLSATRALDRETVGSYELKVLAIDSGKPQLSAQLELHITVEDINDNPPVFQQKSNIIMVKENEPPQTILRLTATDKDVHYNAIIHYSIEAPSFFNIGELSGNIMTLQPLDYETATQHSIVVKAFNPGEPHFQDTVTITVIVENVNEEGPKFNPPSYHMILEDTSTAGILVVDLNATDENKEFDEGIYYNITDGNLESLFEISSAKGQIILTKHLPKLSTVVHHSLTVSATDAGVPPLSTSVKVMVTLAPSKLSFPVFSEEIYQPAPLSEKALPGTFVIQITALYNASLIYSIVSRIKTDYFSIDQHNGIINTQKYLKVDEFPMLFKVRATDSADPSVFSEASVEAMVLDENDFSPIFTMSLLHASLKEEEPISIQIVQLKALDNDTGRNGFLTYGIQSGDAEKFRINATNGIVYADISFDYEEGPPEYQIVVYAEDDGIPVKKRGYCTVIIHISDINDCKPEFAQSYTMRVEENESVGSVIGRVTATDRDSGDNASILYIITDSGSPFEIDGMLGNIHIKSPLDYETKNQYALTVVAKNNKSAPYHESNIIVNIVLIDVNDNAPEFTQKHYFANVNMINPAATNVITITAMDRDQGENAVVEYYLPLDFMFSQFFMIENPNEGKILTTGNLPRSGEFVLTVLAKDRGYPPLNSTVKLTVNVVDNQLLNQTEISTTVRENTGAKYLVYTFAESESLGKHMTYKIVAGNDGGHFTLNENNGQLRTSKNLNYEERSLYEITVEAQERLSDISASEGSLSENRVKLIIFVEDINEAPSFVESPYSTRILNSVSFRFPVIKVEASDPDSGEYGILRYSLLDQPSSMFSIDEKTGQIFVLSVAGMVGAFSFKVQARDQGGRGLLAQTKVDVTIDPGSVNDDVTMSVNQMINVVEQHIMEIKGTLKDVLEWNVYITDLVANTAEKQAKAEPEEKEVTFIKIVAIDENNQAVPAEEVRGKLKTLQNILQKEFEKIFERNVNISVKNNPNSPMSSELIATIVLSILVCCLVVAFSAFVGITLYRKKRSILKQALSHIENQYPDDHGTEGSSSGANKVNACTTDLMASQESMKDVVGPTTEAKDTNGACTTDLMASQESMKDVVGPTMEARDTNGKTSLGQQNMSKSKHQYPDKYDAEGSLSRKNKDDACTTDLMASQESMKGVVGPTTEAKDTNGKSRVISCNNLEDQSENVVSKERWDHHDLDTAMFIKTNELAKPEVTEGVAYMQEPIVEKPSSVQEENASMFATFPPIHTQQTRNEEDKEAEKTLQGVRFSEEAVILEPKECSDPDCDSGTVRHE